MASAALVTAADGPVTLAKRHVLDQILETIGALKEFDVHSAVDLFDELTEAQRNKPESGRAKAVKAIAEFSGDSESGQLLVRIATALARAEGRVSAPAKAEIEQIAAILGAPAPDLDQETVLTEGREAGRPWIVVVGNQKGGTGKSTMAMHLVVALLRLGHRVGSIDLDADQGTLSRYVANREALAKTTAREIPLPLHRRVEPCEHRDRDAARGVDRERLQSAIAVMADCQFVVVDTPGHLSDLSRLGHAHADVLLTPLNDSFLDLDALARIDRVRREVLGPGSYCEMVWAQNTVRATAGRAPIDWIVMRNRLAHVEARNTREMAGLLRQLAARLNFRLEPGFSERVIFRELFYSGLTVLDPPEQVPGVPENPSHLNARREMDDLLRAIGLPETGLDTPLAARPTLGRA